MIGSRKVKLIASAAGAALVAAIAASIADPSGNAGNTKAYYYVGGHVFGIGEEQVYVIARRTLLHLRYRDASGVLRAQSFEQSTNSSIAWTIEAVGSSGGPVLGVATAAPQSSTIGDEPESDTGEPGSSYVHTPRGYGNTGPQAGVGSQLGPQPSPMLDAQGAGSANGVMADLAPASFVLSTLTNDIPVPQAPWTSLGVVKLHYGLLELSMSNVIPSPADQNSVVQIQSSGRTSLASNININGFGAAKLRGGGSANVLTFVESANKLLLGMSMNATNRGNIRGNNKSGSYELQLAITIKLVRYIPGIPLYAGPVLIAVSAYLGRTEQSDGAIYSTATPVEMSRPAPTDTEFIPPPTAAITPYPSTLPEVSLPPIPIPVGSDQPLASPPPPPTPTPTPTRYFY